jgi:hypothetical protein
MLENADLDTAVARGIVSQAQATALRELASERARERAVALGHEERFRFLRGFNDVFFTIGVALLVAGLTYFMGGSITGRLFIAAVVWGLAEILIARLRLMLPALLLTGLFVAFVFLGVPVESWLGVDYTRTPNIVRPEGLLEAFGSIPGLALVVASKALVAAAAAGAFYYRFRVPFALSPLATSLVFVFLAAASKVAPAARISDPLVLLICGLGVFAAAMALDMSDRERLTRRADEAFWLHLAAAPLIVHSLIWLALPLLGSAPAIPGPYSLNMTPGLAIAIVLIFALLAIVAILIDRRALLVSGLAYLGAAVGYAITSAKLAPGNVPFSVAGTLAILGALVLALGVGWMPLRQRLMSLLSAGFANRLPPVPTHP